LVACSHSVKSGSSGAHAVAEACTERLLLIRRLKYLEAAHQRFVHAHHRARVVELAAVVGGGEERHKLALAEELVAVFYDLVGAADQVDVVSIVELLHDVFAEREAHSAIVLAPVGHFLVGIGPKKVAQKACVWHVCWTHDIVDRKNFV
jgi:hypothetical protein